MSHIVFEGIDASGKSTAIQAVSKFLNSKQIDHVLTREPGATHIGSQIRKILLDKKNTKLHSDTETLLFYADRKQHIEDCIKPALSKNKIILSDRYWPSTSAYQCGGRGVSEEFVQNLYNKICSDYEADVFIFLDLPANQAQERLKKPKKLVFLSFKSSLDRIETEKTQFYQDIRSYYLKIIKKNPDKWISVDATQTAQQLVQNILQQLHKKLPSKFPSP